jgi:hypothetical protein
MSKEWLSKISFMIPTAQKWIIHYEHREEEQIALLLRVLGSNIESLQLIDKTEHTLEDDLILRSGNKLIMQTLLETKPLQASLKKLILFCSWGHSNLLQEYKRELKILYVKLKILSVFERKSP